MPTSFIESIGSGDITVRAEKLTLLPERLDLNLPSLPFSLWTRVFSGLPDLCLAGGIPEVWLSKYVVIWYCSSSHRSSTISCGAPESRFSLNLWLILNTSTSLCVRSSSDLSPESSVMDGRTVTGGTGKAVKIIHSGLETSGFSPMGTRSSFGMRSSLSLTSLGVSLCPSSLKVEGLSSVILSCSALQ